MQPICSFNSVPRGRVWFLIAADAVGMAAAMFAAVFLRLGWSDGLGYVKTHQVILLASWGTFMFTLGMAGLYEPDQLQRLGRTLTATSA